VNAQLKALIGLQQVDTKIGGIEAQVAKLPVAIAKVRADVEEAKTTVETIKARLDTTRKSQRAQEKDLEDNGVKRQKFEGQLYQVKTNKEYSAVLVEIDEVKQEKSRIEEEILTFMEAQERLAAELRDGESQLQQRQANGQREEATLAEQLRRLEAELAVVRGQRIALASQLPAGVLDDYDRILHHRGVAVVEVANATFCGGCRVAITPQRLQELRQQNALIHCESCGRYLVWVA
jgi:hypothetical protein